MALSVVYWDVGSESSLLTTELNSLASSAALTAGAISSVGGTSGVFNNVQGGGGLGGFTQALFLIHIASLASAPTAGTGFFFWFINSLDGSLFEDGSATITPARRADLVIPVRAATGVQNIIVQSSLPPNSFYVLCDQNTGQTLASSGNYLKVCPVTNQFG
jgi:hypothetical protein